MLRACVSFAGCACTGAMMAPGPVLVMERMAVHAGSEFVLR